MAAARKPRVPRTPPKRAKAPKTLAVVPDEIDLTPERLVYVVPQEVFEQIIDLIGNLPSKHTGNLYGLLARVPRTPWPPEFPPIPTQG